MKIFETSVIETSAAANNVGLTLVDHPIVGSAIGFDFLDPGDGAVFSVVHDGNKLTDIRLNGEIIGGRIWRTVAHGEKPTEGGSQQWNGVSAWQRPRSGRFESRIGAYAAFVMFATLRIRFGPCFTVGCGPAADRDRIDSSKWRAARLTARVPAPAAEIL
jgi:hypothetical protein